MGDPPHGKKMTWVPPLKIQNRLLILIRIWYRNQVKCHKNTKKWCSVPLQISGQHERPGKVEGCLSSPSWTTLGHEEGKLPVCTRSFFPKLLLRGEFVSWGLSQSESSLLILGDPRYSPLYVNDQICQLSLTKYGHVHIWSVMSSFVYISAVSAECLADSWMGGEDEWWMLGSWVFGSLTIRCLSRSCHVY